jgi:hypothetical protein
MTTNFETEKDLLGLHAPCARPVAVQLEQHLRDLPRPKQLATVLGLLQVGVNVNEHVIEVVAEAWGYLREHRLWDVVHASLSAFQEEIEFAKGVQPMLERHTAVLARMQTACKGIRDRWGGRAPDLLADLVPPRFTRHVLELLHRLSKSCSLEHALDVLRKIVDARLATPKTSKSTWITQGDISKALLQLKITQPLADSSSSSTGFEGPGLCSVHKLISSTSEASSAVSKRTVREEQEITWTPSRKRARELVLINEARAVPSPLVASEAVPAHAWAATNASSPFADTTHEKVEHGDKLDRAITQV